MFYEGIVFICNVLRGKMFFSPLIPLQGMKRRDIPIENRVEWNRILLPAIGHGAHVLGEPGEDGDVTGTGLGRHVAVADC